VLRLNVARSAAEIETLSAVWDSLFHPDLSLFQTFRWNRLAAQIFASREAPYFVFAENENGAAILPAVIDTKSRTISFAGERLFDYRDYLGRGDRAPIVAAWQQLGSLDMPLSITAVCRAESEIWKGMPKHFFSRAPRLQRNAISPEEFAKGHSRAFSRLRKLERMGLAIHQYSGDSPIIRQIYTRRAAQSAEGELFHDAARVEFMIAACREEGTRCEVFSLEHGSTLAAALVTFRDGDYRRFYTIYYDHKWARFSPGVSLLFEVSRRSLEQGINFDLMTGEQGYKLRIARSAQDLFTVNASASQLREFFPGAISGDKAA